MGRHTRFSVCRLTTASVAAIRFQGVARRFHEIDEELSTRRWIVNPTTKFHGVISYAYAMIKDDTLKSFMTDVAKPAVKAGIGYGFVDLRDKSRAGVIDNIISTEIRGAAFVMSDLSHANPGAYWEGGYTEGLGKPVVYLSEE